MKGHWKTEALPGPLGPTTRAPNEGVYVDKDLREWRVWPDYASSLQTEATSWNALPVNQSDYSGTNAFADTLPAILAEVDKTVDEWDAKVERDMAQAADKAKADAEAKAAKGSDGLSILALVVIIAFVFSDKKKR